ncbi:hypothetical protein NIES22_04500 [Calothrix brevissima NIES-22]|nr:hypothetical protein NIES22_04500 [Calothrix brevissima NIES-22]
MNLISTVQKIGLVGSITAASLSMYSIPLKANQPACVITDKGVAVCDTLKNSQKNNTTSNQSSKYQKELNGFIVLLKGCTKSDTSVKCDLVITNKGAERGIDIMAWYSAIVDSEGKSYAASLADIGGHSDNNVGATISPGINYALSITFDKLPEQIVQAPILKFTIFGIGDIQFRNVPFINPTTTNPSSEYQKDLNHFVVLLKGCAKSDTSVKCDMTITNQGAERGIDIMAWYSAIVDSEGKSYSASLADIGGHSDNHVGATISPGINYALSITFDKLPEQIVQAPLLKFSIFGIGDIQFRNVPFTIGSNSNRYPANNQSGNNPISIPGKKVCLPILGCF